MINETEKVQYRKYPILSILLKDTNDPHKSRLIRFIVQRFNRRMVNFYNSCFQNKSNTEMHLYLLNLIYKDFKNGLLYTKLSSLEKQRMNGYLKAKWGEYKKLISGMQEESV